MKPTKPTNATSRLLDGRSTFFARACGVHRQWVQAWRARGWIPEEHRAAVVAHIEDEEARGRILAILHADAIEVAAARGRRAVEAMTDETRRCASCGGPPPLMGQWCRACHPQRCTFTRSDGQRCRAVNCRTHEGGDARD